MINTIIQGDALKVLKGLPNTFVQCVVTSPPYYGLRDYGVEGQLGLEETPECYVEKLMEVFHEVHRVLRNDGLLWLNLGDSYVGYKGKKYNQSQRRGTGELSYVPMSNNRGTPHTTGLPSKNLLGIPWRVAFALQADGWILRSDVIWQKSNSMPESTRDRPTKSHEYIFLFAKNQRYYYNANAIAEPCVRSDNIQTFSGNKGSTFLPAKDDPNYRNGKHQWGRSIKSSTTRNRRSVWSIPTRAYSGAHFATFPPKLIEPCILAGTSPYACKQCGTPWAQVTISTGHINTREKAHTPFSSPTKTDSTNWAPTRKAIDQWEPICTCIPNNTGQGHCIVLDPFCGSGTTLLVAQQYRRAYIGIELNPAYINLAKKRIKTAQLQIPEE